MREGRREIRYVPLETRDWSMEKPTVKDYEIGHHQSVSTVAGSFAKIITLTLWISNKFLKRQPSELALYYIGAWKSKASRLRMEWNPFIRRITRPRSMRPKSSRCSS